MARQRDWVVWAMLDGALLVLAIAASSEALIRFGPLQSMVWLLCYVITILRLSLIFPQFLQLLARNLWILPFPVICLMSALWSYSPAASLIAGSQISMTLLIALFIGWRFSILVICKVLFWVLGGAIALSVLHGVVGVFPWPSYGAAGGLLGIFTQKNMMAQKALFTLLICVAIWLLPKGQVGGGAKRCAIAMFGISCCALLLSRSGTSLLLALPSVGLLLMLCIRRVHRGIALPVLILLVLTLSIAPVVWAVSGVDVVAATLGALGKDATLTGRTLIWEVARGIHAQHPVLGVGHSAFWTAPDFSGERDLVWQAGATSPSFHNFILELLVALGWPGVGAMLLLIGMAFLRLGRLYLATRAMTAALGLVMMVVILANALLIPALFRPHEFMLFVMVMLAVSAQEDFSAA